jgi:hypothetical protein
MTVAELIAELQKMPPDAIVMTDAGEGAWAEAGQVVDCGVDERPPWPSPAPLRHRVSIGPIDD